METENMASHAVHTWTLGGLVGAFVNLAFAYFLLWVSASLFIPLKCLNFFGIDLPCSCYGHSCDTSSNLCLYKLLFDWPIRAIYLVQNSAKSRFPFNLIWLNDQACRDGFIELEGEACYSPFLGSRLQNFVDDEGGYDAKGKRIMNQKQRAGIRRRRKTQSGHVSLANSRQPVSAGVSSYSCNDFEMRSESSERSDPVSIIEDGSQDDGSATDGLHMSERTRHGFEMGAPCGENKNMEKGSSPAEHFSCIAEDNPEIVVNEMNTIKMLEEALEEEKAFCAALYLELEKERAAAATAADEAMAMILRLQEDKASVEMEARQYQRMIEEKSSYDEAEMKILKEILVRRERENHFLEKEIEAYRQELLGNEQSEGDFDSDIDNGKETLVQPSEMSSESNQLSSHECEGMKTEPAKTHDGIEEKLSSGGEELDKGGEQGDENFLQSSNLDAERAVFEVHVIDENTELWKEVSRKGGRPPNYPASGPGVRSSKLLGDCPNTIRAETEAYIRRRGLEMNNCSSMLGNPQQRDILSSSGRNSGRNSPAINPEKFKLETEVEWLRDRLRIVQEEKEKLAFSAERREKVNGQLRELMNQLREIQGVGKPVRQVSLPSLF